MFCSSCGAQLPDDANKSNHPNRKRSCVCRCEAVGQDMTEVHHRNEKRAYKHIRRL